MRFSPRNSGTPLLPYLCTYPCLLLEISLRLYYNFPYMGHNQVSLGALDGRFLLNDVADQYVVAVVDKVAIHQGRSGP